MCGIVGWATPAARRQSEGLLRRLTDAMAHRGPDGAGHWLGETADGRYQLAFGHRRLSIIDIGGGAQPMWSADGRVGIILNGEIYNYIELRQELVAAGHRFRTSSDTEVLLEAWREWGEEAWPRLNGMFACAIWDADRQALVLARDPFGKKPLFVAEFAGTLLFASEIAPMLDFPGLGRDVEQLALGHYLVNRYVPGPLTFFAAIRKLMPGSVLTWRAGACRVRRYFTPPLASTEPELGDFRAAVGLLSGTLDEAVRLRMRSDAPFGAFLSGGIDSSAVVSAMARHASGKLRTFSVGFPARGYSELDHARLVAGHFGTDHAELVVTPEDFAADWRLAVRRRGAPVSEASDIPILMLSRLAARSVKMVLTGEGSDEMLGGYPKHRAEPWLALYRRLVSTGFDTRVLGRLAAALPYRARRLKVLAEAAGVRDEADRMRFWFGGLAPAQRDLLLGASFAAAPPDPLPFSLGTGSALRRTLFFDQTSWLPDNLLERGDRMMMAASIEGRMPFMDPNLAALAARMPDRFLIGGPGGKTVLRAAMAEVLPRSILERRKIGFRVPFGEWLRGPMRDLLADTLTSERSQVARLCEGQAVDGLVREHLAGRHNHERTLWSLINLELFLREYRPDGLEALTHGRARRIELSPATA